MKSSDKHGGDHSAHIGSMTEGSQSEHSSCHSQGSSIAGSVATPIVVLCFLAIGLRFLRTKNPSISERKIDLFRMPFFEKIVRSRYFSFFFRLIPALLFILIICTGLFGRERANLAAPFTWLFWWTLLVFFVAFGGKIFCAACPWDFFANLFQFGWFHRLRGRVQSLNLKWPKALSNIYLAVVLFIVLTWLELGAEVAYDSYATAILGLVVVGVSILFALVFEKRAFCRYACPVGRISGLYSQFSPIELRTKNPEICKDCTTKECVRGGPASSPCPTSEVPFRLQQNNYCTLCTECVRSCEKKNLTLKLRVPGYDLRKVRPIQNDEFILALCVIVLTFFHGLTMTPIWYQWTSWIEATVKFNYLTSFTLLMASILFGSFVMFQLIGYGVRKVTGAERVFPNLVYAFIPLVLGYHIGHNAMHLLGEVLHLVPLANDPFGYGWNLFGLSAFEAFPLLSHEKTQWIQLLAIVIGFYFSVKILRIRTGSLCRNGKLSITSGQAQMAFASHCVLLAGFGLLGVWFVFQPMVMRSTY